MITCIFSYLAYVHIMHNHTKALSLHMKTHLKIDLTLILICFPGSCVLVRLTFAGAVCVCFLLPQTCKVC